MSRQHLAIIAGILIALGYTLYLIHLQPTGYTPVASTLHTETTVEDPIVEVANATVMIQLTGAVSRPGIYDVPAGERLKNVLHLAGGVLPNANLDKVNLVAKVKDGKRYNFPFLKRGKANKKRPRYNTASSPTIRQLNVNLATRDQLLSVPGIGPATADAILELRSRKGFFDSLSELSEARGVGRGVLAKIVPYLEI